MADSPRKPGDPGELSKIGTVRSSGRRRLLQAGISAAPVVMTVASRPVLATIDCRTPSGFVSGFASGAPVGQCGGGFPLYWVNQSNWDGTPYTKDTSSNKNATTFNSLFPTRTLNPDQTLLQVLNLPDPSLAKYIVAALLNNPQKVPDTILPLATIKTMWIEAAPGGTGFGVGIPGADRWNGDMVIAYLKSTMTLPS